MPCPYSDVFEVPGRHWGLIWSGPPSHNYVRLYHDWTYRLTTFADGRDIAPDIRADLARRNIPVVDGRITEIARHGGHNATVKLDTAPNVHLQGARAFIFSRWKRNHGAKSSLSAAVGGMMSGFKFRFSDRDGDVAPDEVYDFNDLFAAIDEAKRVLAEMALDGIPTVPGSSMTVEVVNADGLVAARVGLTLNVEYPYAG